MNRTNAKKLLVVKIMRKVWISDTIPSFNGREIL